VTHAKQWETQRHGWYRAKKNGTNL
jgi:hypothetical protein